MLESLRTGRSRAGNAKSPAVSSGAMPVATFGRKKVPTPSGPQEKPKHPVPAGSRASHLTRPLQWAGPERSAPEAAGRCCLLPITRKDDRTHCGRSRASPGLPRLLCSLRLPTVREGLAPPLTPAQSRPCSTSCGSPVSLGPASFTRARPPSLLRPQLPLLAPSRPRYVRPQPPLFLWSRLPSLFEPQLPSPVPASLPRSSGAGLPLGSGPPSLLRPSLSPPTPASLALPAPAFPVHPGPDRCGRWQVAGTGGCCKVRWAADSVRARSSASGPGRSSAAAPSPASAACWRRRPAQWPERWLGG